MISARDDRPNSDSRDLEMVVEIAVGGLFSRVTAPTPVPTSRRHLGEELSVQHSEDGTQLTPTTRFQCCVRSGKKTTDSLADDGVEAVEFLNWNVRCAMLTVSFR